jgi:hypothetical protein
MNKSLLNEHIDNFVFGLSTNIKQDLDYGFKIPVDNTKYDYHPFVLDDFWKNNDNYFTVIEFNKYWVKFCKNAEIENEDKKYTIEKILESFDWYLNHFNTYLKEKTERDSFDINSENYSHTVETATNFGMIKDFFERELEKYELLKTENKVLDNNNQSNNANPEPIQNTLSNYSWKKQTTKKPIGYKTDLCELIYSLHKTEMIIDNRTGVNISQENLINVFNQILDTDITKESLKMNTGKRTKEKAFTNKLNELLFEKSIKPPKK